jgi:hypothetical protein
MKKLITIVLLLMPLTCEAIIDFYKVKPISLHEKNGGFIFIFKLEGKSEVSTLEVKRRVKCLSSGGNMSKIYKGSIAEYEAAFQFLSAQVKLGEEFTFGLNSLSIPNQKNHFWAVNLKLFAPNKPAETAAWSVNADIGDNLCPYEKL